MDETKEGRKEGVTLVPKKMWPPEKNGSLGRKWGEGEDVLQE
jgi:hypothetical protein